MHLPKRHLSKHHRARLIAWALAVLSWMASVLFAGAHLKARHLRQRHRRISFERLARMVKQLIISRAADFAPRRRRGPRKFSYRGRDLTPRHVIRAVIGSRVRRVLKRQAIGERIATLMHVLRNLDIYARIVAKRLRRRGLTRLWPIFAAPTPAAPIVSLAAASAFSADSS